MSDAYSFDPTQLMTGLGGVATPSGWGPQTDIDPNAVNTTDGGAPAPAAAPPTQGQGLGSFFSSWFGGGAPPAGPAPIGTTQQPGWQQGAIGLGLGLLAGNPFNKWGPALQGYQRGAAADVTRAQQANTAQYQQQQLALHREQLNRAPEAIRQLQAMGIDPRSPRAQELLYPRTEEWAIIPGDALTPPRLYNKRTAEYRDIDQSGGTAVAAPTAPTAPATTGGPTAPTPQRDISALNGLSPAGRNLVIGVAEGQIDPESLDAKTREAVLPRAMQYAPGFSYRKPPPAHVQASIEKADDAVRTNQDVINNLNYAKKISPNAPSGVMGRASEFVAQAAPEHASEQVKNRMLLRNTVTANAVEQLKSIFGGNPSEGERKILLDMAGSVDQPDSVRQQIYDRAIAAAQRRLDQNQQRAQELRSGSYYTPGGGTNPRDAARQELIRRGVKVP